MARSAAALAALALAATLACACASVAHAEAAAGGAAPKYPRANPLQQVAGAVDKVQGAVNTATAVGAAVQSGIDYTQCQLTTGYQVVATSVQEVASWFGKTDVICNHGNWCGAKCSGSGGTAPAVDNLDAACKEHDLCLAGKPSATCGNCDCDGALHKKAQAIYDQGKAAKTCKLFNLLCGKTQKSQAAGWVAASQYARRLCNTCPGIKLGVGGLAAGVKTALAVVKPAPIKSLPPCRTATAIADMYSELTEPEQTVLNITLAEPTLVLNVTDPAFKAVAPMVLSVAAAANTTLLGMVSNVAVALDSFSALATGTNNATMQGLVNSVVTTVAQATAVAGEVDRAITAALGTAQTLANITALAAAAVPDAGTAIAGAQQLVQSLVTDVARGLEGVAAALAGDEDAALELVNTVADALSGAVAGIASLGAQAGAEAEAAGSPPVELTAEDAQTQEWLAAAVEAGEVLPAADPTADASAGAADPTAGPAPTDPADGVAAEEGVDPTGSSPPADEPPPAEEEEASQPGDEQAYQPEEKEAAYEPEPEPEPEQETYEPEPEPEQETYQPEEEPYEPPAESYEPPAEDYGASYAPADDSYGGGDSGYSY